MENSLKKDNKQMIFNLSSQLISHGVNFALIMIFAKILPTDQYGLVAVYQAYTMILSIVLGLNTYSTIGVALVHIDLKEKWNYFASIFLLSMVSFAIIFFAMFFFISPISGFTQLSVKLMILMIFHSFGVFSFNFLNVISIYLRKAEYSLLLAGFVAIVMLLITVVGIVDNNILLEDYVVRILGIAVPYILCIFIAMVIIFKNGNPLVNLKEYWSFCIKLCIPLVFSGLASVILAQTDKIIIQKISYDLSLVGIYSFMVTLVHLLSIVGTALGNTWTPMFYGYLKEGNTETLIMRGKRYLHFFTLLVISFVFASPEFVKIFGTEEYLIGIELVPILALSIFAGFLTAFFSGLQMYEKKTRTIAFITIASTTVNVMLDIVLVYFIGIKGAAFATLIVSLVSLGIYCIITRKSDFKNLFNAGFFMRDSILAVLAGVIFLICKNYIYVRWGIVVMLSLILIYNFYKNKSFF